MEQSTKQTSSYFKTLKNLNSSEISFRGLNLFLFFGHFGSSSQMMLHTNGVKKGFVYIYNYIDY